MCVLVTVNVAKCMPSIESKRDMIRHWRPGHFVRRCALRVPVTMDGLLMVTFPAVVAQLMMSTLAIAPLIAGANDLHQHDQPAATINVAAGAPPTAAISPALSGIGIEDANHQLYGGLCA